jgi:hypothetical protein
VRASILSIPADQTEAARSIGMTQVTYEGHFERLINPGVGSIRLGNLTTSDVSRLHDKIGQTAPGVANRVLTTLSSMYGFAAKQQVLPNSINPARDVERFKENFRERYLTTDEIERIGAVLYEGETVGLPWGCDDTKKTAKHFAKPENRRTLLDPYAVAA